VAALRRGEAAGTLAQPGADELLAGRLTALTGPLASDRLVDAWEELEPPDAATMQPQLLHPSRLKRTEQRLRAAVRPTVHAVREVRRRVHEGADAERFVVAHKFPPIDHRVLAQTAASLASTLGRFEDVVLKPAGPRLVHLSRRGR
jgi:hypothetical protein